MFSKKFAPGEVSNSALVKINKGIWGSYNRRSTANQPRSQGCQSREGSVVSNTILRRESENPQNIATYHSVGRAIAWARAYSGGFNNRGSIADHQRTADFIGIFWKLNWSGLFDFELCCSDSSLLLAITIEHSADPNMYNYIGPKCNVIIMPYMSY